MIKLKQAVIVEGKYDKIRLSNFLDALIITTDGFSLFKDTDKRRLISLLAKEVGIIIMTDSDNAGNLIRSHIKGFVKEGSITEVYVPAIKGKERRKEKPSAEGLLGVEGLSDAVLKEALLKSGITENTDREKAKITKTDLYFYGLNGSKNSSVLRKRVLVKMKLPDNLSQNSLVEYINLSGRAEELKRVCEECLQEEDKK